MSEQKIELIKLIEEEFKTTKKFQKAGTLRMRHLLINVDNKTALNVLQDICEKIDCNFLEVLDSINRTTR